MKKGESHVVKDRLWALVDKNGKICAEAFGFLAIYRTRREALANKEPGDVMVRLEDVRFTVL